MSERSSSSNPTNGIVNTFKDAVHEWMQIQDYITETQATIRQKRKRIQQLEYYITTYLRDNNKEYCNIGDKEALCLKNRKTTSTLKKEHVIAFLKTIVHNEEKAQEYTKQLYDMREVKEKSTIKRINL